MKKKIFSFMMALFAIIGAVNAQVEVQVGYGITSSEYLPSYSYYYYSLSEQIYTAEEIGTTGTIQKIAFYNSGQTKTRNYTMYVSLTSKSSFN
ncbi:MAG: hypothetical protein KBT27_03275, partial [Prevotellaceae bacterium]|nr:hypothetical protein [Candidatus Faecinaster equi]